MACPCAGLSALWHGPPCRGSRAWEQQRMINRRKLLTAPVAGTMGMVAASTMAKAATPAATAPATKTGIEAIWRTYYDNTRVWGYVDRHSVDAGQKFNLMLSTGPNLPSAKGRIEIYRIGHYDGSD